MMINFASPPHTPGLPMDHRQNNLAHHSPRLDFSSTHIRQTNLEDTVDSAENSFSSSYSDLSEHCLTPIIQSNERPKDLQQPQAEKGSGRSSESPRPLGGDIHLNSIQLDPNLPIDDLPTQLPDIFTWSSGKSNQPLDSLLNSALKKTARPLNNLPRETTDPKPAVRLRSGSLSKVQSLQPVEIECTDGHKLLTIDPPLSTVNEISPGTSEPPTKPASTFKWRQMQELNERNLQRLNEILEGEGEFQDTAWQKHDKDQAESVRFVSSDEDRDDPILATHRNMKRHSFHSEDSSAHISNIPTIATPPVLNRSPFVNDSKERTEPPRPTRSPTSDDEAIRTRRPPFFDPDVVLPLPENDPELKSLRETRDFDQLVPAIKNSIERLNTMLMKQRKVNFDPDINGSQSPTGENFTVKEEDDATPAAEPTSGDEARKTTTGKNIRKLGKVRCTLSIEERMLGIRWLHLVDTTQTTNPNITPEVRYHACILFSLYWGSRSGKARSTQSTLGQDSDGSTAKHQGKNEEEIESSKENRKKKKLIAATAIASLTLATKWHFDFCKPLFTVQLQSFCQTTNFGSFKISPENLIMAERAILFSHPVAGGLWLDCPHAFLEELIHIVPTLNILSAIPEYILRKNYYNVSQSLKYYDEHKETEEIDSDGVWDWPDVMQEFDLVLEKVTTVQEFLAFNPAVFCVIALYLALREVEPGYYEKSRDLGENEINLLGSAPTNTSEEVTKLPIQEKLKQLVMQEEHSELWIWISIDINETMNKVCEALEVSAKDVSECLNWYSTVAFPDIH